MTVTRPADHIHNDRDAGRLCRNNRVVEMFIPRGRQVNRGIGETLRRIAGAAEAAHRPAKDDHALGGS
ncbi:MAG: hypothetical protein ABJB98_12105 [Actinomycetota bacterium]